MVPRLVRKIFGLPSRFVRRALQLWTPSQPEILPVGGLTPEASSELLFALRQAATTAEDERIVSQWLSALELSQVASDRLLHDISKVDRALGFWAARLKAGQHRSFLLLGQGPTSFLLDILAVVTRKTDRRNHLSATDQIERRVIVLRALQSRLLEALSKVHNGAAQLAVLKRPEKEVPELAVAVGSEPVGEGERERLLNGARRATRKCIESILSAVHDARKAVEEITVPPSAGRSEPATKTVVQAIAVAQALRSRVAHRLHYIASQTGILDADSDSSSSTRKQREASMDDISEALAMTEDELDFMPQAGATTSANAALTAAAMASARHRRLITIPEWLATPSKYQRYWVRYTVASVAGLWTLRFLYIHSPLSGSDDLERWAGAATESIVSAYRDRVVGPILQLKDELFQTFRQRRSIVSVQEYETDKASLERMLKDFENDFAKSGQKVEAVGAKPEAGKEGAEVQDTSLPGMAFMMECYEGELKRPIRNLVNGRLLRTILIQVQKLKLDTEAAMLELDQILRANELTVAVVAAIPSLAIAGGTGYLLIRWITPSPPDRKSEALPARMALVEAERALEHWATDEDSLEDQGAVIWRTAQVYWETAGLFRRHSGVGLPGMSAQSEWHNLRQDLIELIAPGQPDTKQKICQRMQRVYSLFQP
ncbi:g11782 [Coccomyxa viridis]|uniref:G11782 protein n=1 Tax=Coccomyxa viridis TaxID=1274662 RepID=A0ABP1GD53_9CHLO